jgi:hypothetical protein
MKKDDFSVLEVDSVKDQVEYFLAKATQFFGEGKNSRRSWGSVSETPEARRGNPIALGIFETRNQQNFKKFQSGN